MQTVALTIGLGNNMFQWAFGQSLKAKGKSVQYHFLNHSNPHTGPNAVNSHSLSLYGIDLPVDLVAPGPFLNERTFSYDPSVYDQPDGASFVGNWQSEKYFAGIEDQIRKQLVFKGPLSKKLLDTAARLNQEHSCFIHIRRGDYTLQRNVEYHGDAGGMAYYIEAMQYVRDRVPDVKFFIFSDDPKWCEANFTDIECVSLLGFNKYEDLLLMQQCRNGIIANSSFSWWAAWLGPDKNNGLVIAPKKWFSGANLDTKDLLPERWVKL